MVSRRTVLTVLLSSVSLAFAQSAGPAFSQSIGIGPYEFPIPGTYIYAKQGGSTVITTQGGERTYTVGLLRGAPAGDREAQIGKVETLLRGNWERFARDEKGEVIREFRRAATPSGLTVFSMATEFQSLGSRQHYVQFAATDGRSIAVLLVEGRGPAERVVAELEPFVALVKVVQ